MKWIIPIKIKKHQILTGVPHFTKAPISISLHYSTSVKRKVEHI